MHETSDRHLLGNFRDGDHEALAVLVARYLGLVRAACLRQAPPDEADDCVQAVFLVLARRPAAAVRAPALAAWLLRVAWFVCRQARRGAHRRRHAEGRSITAAAHPGVTRPEALEHLDDCLAKLPERQRAAVSMHYLAGQSPEDVATTLGVSRDHVYQLLKRGLAALRTLLARRGIVVSLPVLLAVMGDECHAAAVVTATTSAIALSLSAMPSSSASTLAHGTTTAMTINALAPVASIAAALVLSAGIATTLYAADDGKAAPLSHPIAENPKPSASPPQNAPHAGVTGQIIRLELPAGADGWFKEVEVYSGGKNIILNNPIVVMTGSGFNDGAKAGNPYRNLNDGNKDTKFYMNTGTHVPGNDANIPVGVWFEIDLGSEKPIERIVIDESKMWNERGPRLLTVLDAHRAVVFENIYNVFDPGFTGSTSIDVAPGAYPLSGRIVPPGTSQWAPLGDLFAAKPGSLPPDAEARAARFAQRNAPDAIAALAKAFFARMDLAKPGLEDVRSAFSAGQYQGALDRYRDHFLKKLRGITYRTVTTAPDAQYDKAADDLLRGISVIFASKGMAVETFKPGTIDWAAKPDVEPKPEGIDLARSRAMAGILQRPLLTAYRKTGKVDYLRQWEAISDDWGMNYLADCARADFDLRDYFLWHLLQVVFVGQELAETAQKQSTFSKDLSSASLARFLMPMLEEYPPSVWCLARRACFSHLSNTLWFDVEAGEVLDDFYAGERLQQENCQAWHRICNTWLLRDGIPQDTNIHGYRLFTTNGIGIAGRLLQDAPPSWMTSDLMTQVVHAWRMATLYTERCMTPDGTLGGSPLFTGPGSIWNMKDNLSDPTLMRVPALDAGPIMHNPEVAGVFQECFGAGLDAKTLPTWNANDNRKEIQQEIIKYYGTSYVPPKTTSDWMPYAGICTLRSSWKPDATYLKMRGLPIDHIIIGIGEKSRTPYESTCFEVWDHGFHLYDAGPIDIDGLPQFRYDGTLMWWPGSKTTALGRPNDKPVQARWYTSPSLDYAECWYDGAYRKYDSDTDPMVKDPHAIYGARSERRIVFLKQAHLAIATDLVRLPTGSHHLTMGQQFSSTNALVRKPEQEKPGNAKAKQAQPEDGLDLHPVIDGDTVTITAKPPSGPGVVVHQFSNAPLQWDNHRLSTTTAGPWTLCTLIEPTADGGSSKLGGCTPIPGDQTTGFTASLPDGGTLHWITAIDKTTSLKAGTIEATGESLLVVQHGARLQGLVLGATALRIDGRSTDLAQPDIVFERDQDTLIAHPIYRPIDPVEFAPQATVFTASGDITLSSRTPGVQIRYTTDGSEPTVASTLYTAPIHIDRDTYLRARAYRPGATDEPFAVAGTTVTAVSDVTYRKRPSKPAVTVNDLVTGLDWETVQGTWFALFSHLNLPEVMPAVSQGHTKQLLDVSMRPGDGPFGIRYQGYIDIPVSGIWTFRAPEEYIGSTCEPGYDLRLWIDGEEWNLTQETQGLGTWSVPLDQGTHRLLVTFADARNRQRIVEKSGLWLAYPRPIAIWRHDASPISIAGPGCDLKPIPPAWLKRND